MKRLILFVFVVFAAGQLWAESVNEERAKKMASSFLIQKTERSDLDLKLIEKSSSDAWYVYAESNSWVIVSGDTDLYPVLAYSYEGTLVVDNMPDAMRSYLNARDIQLNSIRTKRTIHPENRAAWESFENGVFGRSRESSMEPLIETRWNQDYPYNMFCPVHSNGPGGHVYAGCVATTMSQIMNYYQYPETGRLSHSYFWGENVVVDFSEGNYEWDKMSTTATPESREAIAKLMFHCGVAVDMNYAYDGSGSNIQLSAYALKQYFRYKPGLEFVDEVNYSDAEWKFLLKEDLSKSHPILYRGTSDDGGGHAFVCDAFQDTTFFHFNFGWSGYGDGFFHLDDQDFHWGQGAVINIMPYWGDYCNSMHYTQSEWSFDDGSGPNYYWNGTDCEWLIQPVGAEQVKLVFDRFETLEGDELYVYDGSSVDDPLIGVYSGGVVPSGIVSNGGSLLLRFITDDDMQSSGWDVHYESLTSGVETCVESSVNLYPNPVEDVLNLEMNNANDAEWMILNAMGRVLDCGVLDGKCSKIDVSDLSVGFYYLKVIQDEIELKSKFIIQ